MKLVYLGLLLIFSCIIIYEIANYKEGFNYEEKNNEQKNWTELQKDYWKAENSPNITETGEENTVLQLNKDKTKLVEVEPVERNEKSDLALEIEKCQTINKTGKCDNLLGSSCGYCGSSNKIMYGDESGPFANVCQADWVPPGPSASKGCIKIKEQKLCSQVTDCGDSTGDKSVCGWCPATLKGVMAKEDGSMMPKYEDDKCEWNNTSDIKGVLIKPNDCVKFGQLFPCVGPKMLTGPHSEECLQSEWTKSGCGGNVQDRVTNPQFFTNWNSNAYSYIGDNIKTAIKDVADSGKKYDEVKTAYKMCYDKDVNPCENRFDPKPLDCLRKKYSESGCTEDGILNPKTLTRPQAEYYLNDNWMNNQTSLWSANEYATNIGKIFTKANQGKTFPKGPVGTGPIDSGRAFDDALKNNLLCYGNKLEIPFEKPCWKDFMSIMLSNPGIIYNIDNQTLSFKNATSYKNLLITTDNPNNKNTWGEDFQLDKETYKNEYFPFWNFTAVSRTYWSNNWSKFKSELLKNRFVRTASNDNLKFLSNSPFNYLLESTNDKDEADTNGLFWENGNETYLSKQAFDNENFPYWLFLKTAETN